MSAPKRQLTITLDVEAAAEDAFDMFVAHRTRPPRWDTLSEPAKESWRRVARRLLQHVVAQ